MNIYFIRYEDRREYYSSVQATPDENTWYAMLRGTIEEALEAEDISPPDGLYGAELHHWWMTYANDHQLEVQIDIGKWPDVRAGQIFHWIENSSSVSGSERNVQ